MEKLRKQTTRAVKVRSSAQNSALIRYLLFATLNIVTFRKSFIVDFVSFFSGIYFKQKHSENVSFWKAL